MTINAGVVVEGSTSSLAPDFTARVPTRPRVRISNHLATTTNAAALQRIETGPWHADLTRQTDGRPIGQRIAISGRVIDADGNPVPDALIEIWQCNAGGRYRDVADPGEGAIDPHFLGAGRFRTGADGSYQFITVRPAAYPGPLGSGIPYRPAHVHISVLPPDPRSRLITQLYFEGDPLIKNDFVIGQLADEGARDILVAKYDPDTTVHGGPEQYLSYRYDIVLGGPNSTPMEW